MGENAPRIVVVVLVVVVVLFVIGIGAGANDGIGGFKLDNVISRLTSLFPSPALNLDEVQATPPGCLNRNAARIIIPNGGVCQFQIAESSANIRSLKLQSAAGSVHLELTVNPAGDKSMTIKTDLPQNGSDEITLNVYSSGGRLVINQCTLSPGCVINIVN